MLAALRRQRILDEVQLSGSALISSLAEELAVSEMTIRRDMAGLKTGGLLERVDGMDPVVGFKTSNISEAETNRTFIRHALASQVDDVQVAYIRPGRLSEGRRGRPCSNEDPQN